MPNPPIELPACPQSARTPSQGQSVRRPLEREPGGENASGRMNEHFRHAILLSFEAPLRAYSKKLPVRCVDRSAAASSVPNPFGPALARNGVNRDKILHSGRFIGVFNWRSGALFRDRLAEKYNGGDLSSATDATVAEASAPSRSADIFALPGLLPNADIL